MRPFTVSVPASSSNFGSGFDTLSAALAVRLECRVQASDEGGLHWTGGPQPPADNIAESALQAGCRHLGIEPDGLSISMRNPIPLARGMGSSGAAIIAGLAIAQQLAGVQLDPAEILQLACPLEGHPDNLAASLLGGWVLSCASADRILAERIDHRLQARFVLVVPEVAVSTSEARRILASEIPLVDAVFNQQRVALLVHALVADRPDLLAEATRDRLHQSRRAALIPGAAALLNRTGWPAEFQDSILSLTISGSGSTMIAAVRGQERVIGEWMAGQLAAAGTPAAWLVTDLDPRGALVVPDAPTD